MKFLPVSLLIDKLLPLIIKWEWGTTANFLYQYQGKKIDLAILITASRWKSVEEIVKKKNKTKKQLNLSATAIIDRSKSHCIIMNYSFYCAATDAFQHYTYSI